MDEGNEPIAAALRPLVDDPPAPPRPVTAIAADARRRRVRRRTILVAATVVAVLGLAGLVTTLDSPPSVTTIDQPPRPSTAPTTDGSTSSSDAPGTSATTAPSTTDTPTTATTSPPTSTSPPDAPPSCGTDQPTRGQGGPYDPFAGLQAEAAESAAASTATGGAVCLGDGDVLEFADVDFHGEIATRVEFRVASDVDATTTLRVHFNNPEDGAVVATTTVSGGDGWTVFSTTSVAAVGALGGRLPIYLTAHVATPGATVAVDWIRFTP